MNIISYFIICVPIFRGVREGIAVHFEFDDELIKDHIFMLQDKLNDYIWFVDNKQYEGSYPDASLFTKYRIKFKYRPSDFCYKYLNH